MFFIPLVQKINPVLLDLGDGNQVRWYAICILLGAAAAYFSSAFCFKKGGFSSDIPDTLIISAFPAGIIGARIWWCICDASSPWKSGNFWGVITEFKNGGLAVQGGVLLGAIVGIVVMKLKYKNCPVLFAIDAVVPNILIAQTIARWGNFFNQEVYGACVDYNELDFLPDFIQNQMRGDLDGYWNVGEYKSYGSYISCQTDQAAQPLFLYEGIINLIGWILISIVARKFWKKGRKNGDLGGLYFIWYGIVRLVMEPLRNEEFIMSGWGVSASVITSIAFIVIGVLFMVALRVVPLIFRKKQHD